MILLFRKLYPYCCKKELFIGDQATDEECSDELQIPFIKVEDPLSDYNSIKNDLKLVKI